MSKILEWFDADLEGFATGGQELLTLFDRMIGGTRVKNGDRINVGKSVIKTSLDDTFFVFDHEEKNDAIIMMSRGKGYTIGGNDDFVFRIA
jgi:hypothetical protein